MTEFISLGMSKKFDAQPSFRMDCTLTTPISQPTNRPTTSQLMLEARARESETGATLLELERRQDDVLSQLDDLEQKLSSLLMGLGVNLTENAEESSSSIRLADLGDESEEYEVAVPRHFDSVDKVTRRRAA